MFMITFGVRLVEAFTLTLNDVRIDPSGEWGLSPSKGKRNPAPGKKGNISDGSA
jgi:hypothetical protein